MVVATSGIQGSDGSERGMVHDGRLQFSRLSVWSDDSCRVIFYFTSMLLRLLVVVYAHEEYVACVVVYLRGIFLSFYLVDGSVG